MSDSTYKIVRRFKDDYEPVVMERGMTLEAAQEHCKNPETSSSTCKLPASRRYTETYGQWFDGYEEE